MQNSCKHLDCITLETDVLKMLWLSDVYQTCFSWKLWFSDMTMIDKPANDVLPARRTAIHLEKSFCDWFRFFVTYDFVWNWFFLGSEPRWELERRGDRGAVGRGRLRGGRIHFLYGLLCNQESDVKTYVKNIYMKTSRLPVSQRNIIVAKAKQLVYS